MDIEAAVARRIAKATGVPAYPEVPKDAPGSFTTVERIGGIEAMTRADRG